MERIIVPKSVVKIHSYAFSNCKNLREVLFAKGSQLKIIDEGAFCGCIRLWKAIFPEGLEKIDHFAF